MSKNNKNKITQKIASKKQINSTNTRNDSFINVFYLFLFLFISTIVLYGWTAKFGWGLDDVPYIYQPIKKIQNNGNSIVELFGQSYGRYEYRPITLLSFWIENNIFGDLYPSISHLINVLLFAILIIQIFRFIIAADFYENKNKLIALALLTAFLYLIHPVHVSVVANIKSRDNLISMLFGLTALIQFLKFLKDNKIYRIIGVIMLIALAIMSKRDAYVFLLIPALYYFLYKFKKYNNHIFNKQTVRFVGMVVAIFLLVYAVVGLWELIFLKSTNEFMSYSDSPLAYNDTFLNRLSFSFTTLLYYFKFMVIPHGYYFYFGYNQIPLTPLWSSLNLLSLFIYVSLFLLSIRFLKKDKIYLFAILFFLLAIAYAANFFVIVSGILMDRYSFIASLGFLLGCSALILNFLKVDNWHIIHHKFLIPVYIVFIAATIYRTSAWKDTFTLFQRDIPALSQSAQAQSLMGGIYINDAIYGNYTKAEKDEKMRIGEGYIDKALSINNKNKFALESKGLCRIHFNDDRTAIPFLKQAIKVDSNYTGPYNNLGLAYRNIAEIDSALIYFGKGMNKDLLFSYPAINYVQMLILKQRYEAVDSTLSVLQFRFPNDQKLNQNINNWKQHNKWVQW